MPEFLRILEHDLDVWSVTELLDGVDSARTPPELGRAIIRMGLGAPVEFDERFLKRIVNVANHPEFMVRKVAVIATMYPAWPQFRPFLVTISKNDPSEVVRATAAEILGSYDRVGVPEA